MTGDGKEIKCKNILRYHLGRMLKSSVLTDYLNVKKEEPWYSSAIRAFHNVADTTQKARFLVANYASLRMAASRIITWVEWANYHKEWHSNK